MNCDYCGCVNYPGQMYDDRDYGNYVLEDKGSVSAVASSYMRQAFDNVSQKVCSSQVNCLLQWGFIKVKYFPYVGGA